MLSGSFRNSNLGREIIEFIARYSSPNFGLEDIDAYTNYMKNRITQIAKCSEVLRDEDVAISLRAKIEGITFSCVGYDFDKRDDFGIPGREMYMNHQAGLVMHGSNPSFHEEIGKSPYEESSQFQPAYGFILTKLNS